MARLPLELLEMLLLVCMGALGGVIAVTRCFVDTSSPNPRARDLCYRPVAGAVIALGIYVIFSHAAVFRRRTTAPDIHLGFTVVLQKLREFQDAGHTVVLIIGNGTTRVRTHGGSTTRPDVRWQEIRSTPRPSRNRR